MAGAPPASPTPQVVIDPPVVSQTPIGDPAFWPRVMQLCSGSRRVKVMLESARLVEVKPAPGRVTLEVAGHLLAAARGLARDIETLAATIAGEPVSFAFQPAPGSETLAPAPEPIPNVQEHPLVRQAMELFNARVLSVQPRQPPMA